MMSLQFPLWHSAARVHVPPRALSVRHVFDAEQYCDALQLLSLRQATQTLSVAIVMLLFLQYGVLPPQPPLLVAEQ
jgi:hypothetical protein